MAAVAVKIGLRAASGDYPRFGNSVDGHRSTTRFLDFFPFLGCQGFARDEESCPLDVESGFLGRHANPYRGAGEGVNHAVGMFLEHRGGPCGDVMGLVQVDVFGFCQRNPHETAHEKNIAHAPAFLPVHLEIAFFDLRKPSSRGVANTGEAQRGIDARCTREYGKPVGDWAGQ